MTFHWIEDGFGMECLYVTAITVAISWIFRNRGLLTSILEIIAIPSLAFSQTFLRFLVVLWADRLGPFDFSIGWGGFLFHLSFLGWIVLSTWLLMHWLRLAMREIPPPTNRDKTPIGAEVFNRVSRWPWPSTVALAKGSKSSASSSAKKAVDSKTGVDTEPAPEPMQSVCTYRFRFAKWAYGLIGIWAILSILSTISLLILLQMNQNSAWLEGAEAFLSTRTAEFTDDSIVFQPGKIESRPANHPVGELSKSWGHSTVNGAEIQCGLDLGDMERSSPIELYKRYGWKADDSASRKQPTDGSYPTLRMYNPLLKKHGFIIAANFDSSGNPIGFPEDANKRSTGLWGRLASTPISMLFSRIRKKSGVSIHASLICTDNFPIEESQCTELVSLFERISPKMSAIGKGALGK